MIMYRPLIDQYDCEPPGNDDKGLGCCVHMMLGGDDGVTQGSCVGKIHARVERRLRVQATNSTEDT